MGDVKQDRFGEETSDLDYEITFGWVKFGWVNLQGEYLNSPPPIFVELSELDYNIMKRYPNPKLAARMHFFDLKRTLKTGLKIVQKISKYEKLPISWKRPEISRIPQKFSLKRYY